MDTTHSSSLNTFEVGGLQKEMSVDTFALKKECPSMGFAPPKKKHTTWPEKIAPNQKSQLRPCVLPMDGSESCFIGPVGFLRR